jgi:ATP-dependent RNA helicase DeaD
MQRFRRGQCSVLVATDVAARGLDVDRSLARVQLRSARWIADVYVHRVGRTGRAGKTGIAISLVTPQEQWRIRRIESFTRQPMERGVLPTVEEIKQRRETRLLEQLETWLRRGRSRREREMAATLVEAGHDPLDVAAAALKIARAEEKERPIDPIAEVQEFRPREERRDARPWTRRDTPRREGVRQGRGHESHEPGMVRLTMSAGRLHGIRPQRRSGSDRLSRQHPRPHHRRYPHPGGSHPGGRAAAVRDAGAGQGRRLSHPQACGAGGEDVDGGWGIGRLVDWGWVDWWMGAVVGLA